MRLITRKLSLTLVPACRLLGQGDDFRGSLAQGLVGWGTRAPFSQPTVPFSLPFLEGTAWHSGSPAVSWLSLLDWCPQSFSYFGQ